MAHRYRNPPILEASFEMWFETAGDYNVFTPLKIYNELKNYYPADPVLMSDQGIEIVEDQRAGKDTTFRLKREQYRYQLATADSSWLVRFNRRMLSVHSSPPYPGWPAFRERIHQAVNAYLAVAEPAAIQRTSLRYINQISFDEDTVALIDYFTMPPDAPKGSAANLGAFFQRLEFFWPDRPSKLVQTFASTSGENLSVILDLDMISEEGPLSPAPTEDLVRKIDELREMQREAFESLITDKLREMFDAT